MKHPYDGRMDGWKSSIVDNVGNLLLPSTRDSIQIPRSGRTLSVYRLGVGGAKVW